MKLSRAFLFDTYRLLHDRRGRSWLDDFTRFLAGFSALPLTCFLAHFFRDGSELRLNNHTFLVSVLSAFGLGVLTCFLSCFFDYYSCLRLDDHAFLLGVLSTFSRIARKWEVVVVIVPTVIAIRGAWGIVCHD